MTNKNESALKYGKFLWFRVLVFVIFLFIVSLLAGYVAIKLRYASLYNVTASFAEYAIPLPFYWGMLHIPSMLIYGVPLLALSVLREKFIKYFRVFCICSFLLLLLELDKKIPFLLFPKIDALIALIFSFALVPPSREENPVLVTALKLFVIFSVAFLGFYTYSYWKHQSPEITSRQYGAGAFELKSIIVKNDFHKEMVFEVDLKKHVTENQICSSAQPMAKAILQDYPFDNSYNKIIKITFNPHHIESKFDPYELGEISLNDAHRQKGGRYACFVSYKNN